MLKFVEKKKIKLGKIQCKKVACVAFLTILCGCYNYFKSFINTHIHFLMEWSFFLRQDIPSFEIIVTYLCAQEINYAILVHEIFAKSFLGAKSITCYKNCKWRSWKVFWLRLYQFFFKLFDTTILISKIDNNIIRIYTMTLYIKKNVCYNFTKA